MEQALVVLFAAITAAANVVMAYAAWRDRK